MSVEQRFINVIQMLDAKIQLEAMSALAMSRFSMAMVETVTIMIHVGMIRVVSIRNVSKT